MIGGRKMKRRIYSCLLLCIIAASLSWQDVYAYKEFKKIASGVTDIAAGPSNIIYKKNNNAYVIGYDYHGCMGYGEDKIKDKIVMKPNLIGKNVKNIYASFYPVAFLKNKNIFFCGSGYEGEFYKYTDSYYEPTCFVPPQGRGKIEKMWLEDGTLAYGVGNDLWVCGMVLNGYLVTPRQKPKRILKNKLDKVKSVSVSRQYVIVNYKDGSADIIGEDRCGKCVRDKKDRLYSYLYEKPVSLNRFGSDVEKYIAGYDNIGAIKKNGDFYIWGSNEKGFLCDKSLKKKSNQPKCVMKNVEDVKMTQGHVLVLKKDGTVWAWGSNYLVTCNAKSSLTYQITSSKKAVILTPVKIASDVKQIAAGDTVSVILKKNGVAYWRGELLGYD